MMSKSKHGRKRLLVEAMARTEEQDPGWDTIQKITIQMAGHRCLRCRSRSARTNPLTAHHLRPRSRGGKSVESNLVCLCRKCHDWAEIWLEGHPDELMPWDLLTTNPSEPPENKPWKGWTRERWLRAIHQEDRI